MITYDQLAAAIRDEFIRYSGYDSWDDMGNSDREEFYTRLGFAHEALRRAGLIEKSELPNNPNAAIGGGYECSKCGKRHRTSSVHCDVSMGKLTSVNAHGQNTTKL
jgi:hypothetical protein